MSSNPYLISSSPPFAWFLCHPPPLLLLLPRIQKDSSLSWSERWWKDWTYKMWNIKTASQNMTYKFCRCADHMSRKQECKGAHSPKWLLCLSPNVWIYRSDLSVQWTLLDLIFGEMSEEPISRENQLLHIVATWHFSDQDDISLFYQHTLVWPGWSISFLSTHISYINIIDLIDRSLWQILDDEKKRRRLRSTNLCTPPSAIR